jgi:hypothetical protein
MRAINYSVDASAVAGQFGLHALMDIFNHTGCYKTPTDGGLIGDDNNRQAQTTEGRHTIFGIGQELELSPALHVVRSVFTDDAITIQKYGTHS